MLWISPKRSSLDTVPALAEVSTTVFVSSSIPVGLPLPSPLINADSIALEILSPKAVAT